MIPRLSINLEFKCEPQLVLDKKIEIAAYLNYGLKVFR